MKKEEITSLHRTAQNVREEIIKLTAGGGCFIGASLSCVELIVYLYKVFLNLEIQQLNNPERNYLFLSKGHDVPSLYSMFTELGWFEKSRLLNHLKTNDHIYWHPNRKIPGVEFHSGSLGHLLSVAMGVAIDCKIKGFTNKIIVILGDGELNEGSIWEGLLVASAYKLDNLIIVVDRNKFQANERTEELIPLEPLADKFKAFGCNVQRIDGHSFVEINNAFNSLDFNSHKPSAIIADTIRGKGLPSIEERADRWFCKFTHEEIEDLLVELKGGDKTQLSSETIIAR
ncbi:MAG: transketolase [Ignavibacteria bacterium]|nr:transketolase [Ignavibacteria bacterium]